MGPSGEWTLTAKPLKQGILLYESLSRCDIEIMMCCYVGVREHGAKLRTRYEKTLVYMGSGISEQKLFSS